MKVVNREYVRWHLSQAQGQLARTIDDIDRNPDWGAHELRARMTIVYQHVNAAWNARFATPDEAEECSRSNFETWCRYPGDWL